MSDYDNIQVTREGAIAIVTVNRPKALNALNSMTVTELLQAQTEVEVDPGVRAVILTGQGSFFCSGGTKEGLLAIHNRAVNFTDVKLYELPLRCEVPVVAAMAGHAVGGGLVMGMFADIAVMARESIYTANFMRYGFTKRRFQNRCRATNGGCPIVWRVPTSRTYSSVRSGS